MERYYQAKAKLFEAGRAAAGVISVDDDAGRRLAASVSIPVTTVAMARDADVTAAVIDAGLEATTIDIAARSFRETVRVPLAGGFNVSNVAVAAAVAEAEGIAADAVVAGLETVPEIPGRFQRIDEGQRFGVVVDYAHTPDAVANVIGSVRSLVAGRVIAVLGAGGDRDREKRPMMGAAAAKADVAVITSDNPRSEDPAAIVAEVMSGAVRGAATVVAEVDRRSAIVRAIEEAQPGDVVLILGKGHETGQETAGSVEPFDDRVVAREALAMRFAGNGSGR
jgi:UDP-N-acetylmuramoyl-L-alanyl-D-glutamate--2,6-diaminopimelate ligase